MFPKLRHNCIFCAIKTEMYLGAFIGTSPYTVTCEHDSFSNKYKIDYSKFYITVSIVIALLVTCDCIYSLFTIVELFAVVDAVRIVQFVTDVIFNMKGNVIIINGLTSIKTCKKNYEGLIEIIQNAKQFGIDTILDENIIKRLYTYSVVGGWLLMYITIANALYFYYISNLSFGYMLVKLMVSLICFYADAVVLYQHTFILILYKTILTQVFDKTIKEMEISSESNIRIRYNKKSASVNDVLSKVQRLYLAVMRNIAVFSRQNDPFILLWNLLTTAALTANIYLVVKVVISGNTDLITLKEISTETRVISTIILLFQSMLLIEALGQVVSYKLPKT